MLPKVISNYSQTRSSELLATIGSTTSVIRTETPAVEVGSKVTPRSPLMVS